MNQLFHLKTRDHSMMTDITSELKSWLDDINADDGMLIVSSLHTTAGITVNENADPDVKHDMLMRLDNLYPWHHPDDKHMEGNTAAHLKTSTVGHAQMIIVANGEMVLGTWQGIYFCEFDGPRSRKYHATFISGSI